MKPTPSLSVRLRFSTKDVGRGFYRGNRTGSMGSHTPKGGYLIDYRKVRSYNVPDLTNFKLTPYVTKEVHERSIIEEPLDRTYNDIEKNFLAQNLSIARRTRAMEFLSHWKQSNAREFQQWVDYQIDDPKIQLEEARSEGKPVEAIERWKKAVRQAEEKRASAEQS